MLWSTMRRMDERRVSESFAAHDRTRPVASLAKVHANSRASVNGFDAAPPSPFIVSFHGSCAYASAADRTPPSTYARDGTRQGAGVAESAEEASAAAPSGGSAR